jgi:hypothetical protein
MAGINIDVGANVRQFQKGFSDSEDSVTDLLSVLDDAAAEAQRGADKTGKAIGDAYEGGARKAERAVDGLGDKIGESTREGAKEAESATERLEKSFKELADTAKRETKDLGDPMAISTRKGVDDAKEGLNEFKDEANSTAKESAASFDGSFESIGDVVQEIAANAFAGFGPAGAVAGIAAAAGIGIAIAKMEEGAESTERFKERVGELTGELIEIGTGTVGIDYVVDKLKEMATATDDAEVSLADLKDVADDSGASYTDLARAYAGSGEDLDKLIKKTREQKDALEQSNAAEQEGLAYRDKVGGADPRIDATQKYIDYLEQAKAARDEATENERLYAEANGPALAAKAELIENIDSAYDDAAGGAEDFINKESGLFDVQAFIDSMNQRQQALREYQETLATSALSPEAKAFISSQGVDSAATFLAGYKTATPAQQAELNRIWSEAGKTSSGSFSASTQANLDQAGYSADVKLNPVDQALRDYLARTSLKMGVTLVPADGTRGNGLGVLKRVP